jgi:DNA-binding response OmpR family regulator
MLKVMIAEDDLLIADMLQDILTDSGYEVCGIAPTVDKALELGQRHKPDLAVLDIQLAEGSFGTDIPARLRTQNRPGILFTTGLAGRIGLTKVDGDGCLGKPYRSEDVVRALEIVEEIVSTGKASQPFPENFYVLNGPSKAI